MLTFFTHQTYNGPPRAWQLGCRWLRPPTEQYVQCLISLRPQRPHFLSCFLVLPRFAPFFSHVYFLSCTIHQGTHQLSGTRLPEHCGVGCYVRRLVERHSPLSFVTRCTTSGHRSSPSFSCPFRSLWNLLVELCPPRLSSIRDAGQDAVFGYVPSFPP